MKFNKLSILLILCFIIGSNYAQKLNGTIYEYDKNGKMIPLESASVYWLGTTIGCISNQNGKFSLERSNTSNMLVIRYVGYQTDTLNIKPEDDNINIVLTGNQQLQGVTITSISNSYVSTKPILTQVITGDGLRKAACCNLSESFESSATVDVSYSDAISGAKQIQMLGLAGIYSQIMLENTPYIRGLSAPFGLMFIPGSWMESINVSKGNASVINGYESITGQIDINYKKPETNKEKVFLNLFLNSMLKSELNFNTRIPVKENVSTMLLFHAENQPLKLDHNKDGFIDVPLSTQINFMNRWDYHKPNKIEGRTMISYLYDTRIGGEMDFNKKTDHLTTNNYGIGIDNHRFNIISKNGILLKGAHESIGTIASFTYNNYNSFYGLNTYFAEQYSGYANAFYENYLDKKDRHKIDVGISYQIDAYKERFNDSLFFRLESVPGAFAQYSYILDEKLIIIAGFRADINSNYGLFWTPRLHLKWQVAKQSSFRLSAGKGYRSANIFIENTALLSSQRHFEITEPLQAEEAYNAGISFSQNFKIKNEECTFVIDYFYTHFINQVIVDVDKDYRYVYFYNLTGRSYSHTAQAELIIYPFKRFEITAAYRFCMAKETINNQLRDKPLTSRHKGVLNLSYATKFNKWKFNITAQLHGATRLPDCSNLPKELQWEKYSPTFFTFNAQITKKTKHFEIYLGVENFTNYKQSQPIVDAQNPFGNYFDASIIWGPISGIMGYAGMRFDLKY